MSAGIGIVGLGNIAKRVAAGVLDAPDAHLAAVMSRDAGKAGRFADEHGATRSYDDLDAFLADPAVDGVYISTPNALHAEQALAALRVGKHVLVEKPMALDVSDADALVRAAADAGRLLGVGFHLRFHPVHREIRRLVAAGSIGTPVYVEGMFGSVANMPLGSWALDPAIAGHGSLTGLGVHLIDLLPWLLGDPIAEVAAMSDGPSDQYPVEFLTTAVLRFASGTQGGLTCSRRLPNAHNSVRVFGTDGLLEGLNTVGVNVAGVLRRSHDGESEVTELPLADLYTAEIGAFAAAVRDRAPFAPNGEDGRRSVAVTTALADSAANGRAVTL